MSRMILKLFITGRTTRSETALANLNQILSDVNSDDYELTVIDVLERPQIAEDECILATPVLVRMEPGPPRRVIGDMSQKLPVIECLDPDRTRKDLR
jgi:circadian clock protein KaiB